jgi:uncharacterized protein (DUF934 family)
MPLLKLKGFTSDDWQLLGPDDPLPSRGDIALPWARLVSEWDNLVKHDGRLGVVFPNNEKAASLALYLHRLALIVLNFPVFNDGRSFSIARQLRLEGYAGEIRAGGNVMPDLLQFMVQVGFDAFDVSDRFSPEFWLKSLKRISLTYQHGLADEKTPLGAASVWKARHRPSAPPDDRQKTG